MGSFGSGPEPIPRRLVEGSQMVGAPRHAGLARETLTFHVDGVEQVVEIVRQPRHLGGSQAYWCCPKCSALRSHLFVLDGRSCAASAGSSPIARGTSRVRWLARRSCDAGLAARQGYSRPCRASLDIGAPSTIGGSSASLLQPRA